MSEFIQNFRVKNPQYNDMPDDQLVTALHNKYYSDIPIEQFNQKIGFQAAQPIEQQPIEQPTIQDQEVDAFTGAAEKAEAPYQGPVAEPWKPTLWEQIKSLSTSDSKKARAMNEFAARQIAKEQGIPVKQVYKSAGFLRPLINPEGRPGVQAFTEGATILGEQAPEIPQGVVNSVLRVIRGGDETVEDNWLDDAIKYTEPSKPENVDPNYEPFYGVGKSLGTSLTSIAAAATATALAAETGPLAPAAGGVASATVAYRSSKDEFIERIKTILDDKSKQINGRPLNQEEWDKALDEYDAAATKYGASEAIFEALSNMVFVRALAAPMKGLGKNALEDISKRATKVMLSEQATETATGVGQSGAEAEAGIGEQKTVGEAFRDQVVQTGIITGIMGGAGASAKYTYETSEQILSPERTIAKEMEAQLRKANPEISEIELAEKFASPIAQEIYDIKRKSPEEKTVAEMVKEKIYDNGIKLKSEQKIEPIDKQEEVSAETTIQEEVKPTVIDEVEKPALSDMTDKEIRSEIDSLVETAAKKIEPSKKDETPQILPDERHYSPGDYTRLQELTEEENNRVQDDDVLADEDYMEGEIEGLETFETPVSEITVSKDVPQFKEGADVEGVVDALGGKFDRTGVAPIQIWVREDGSKEVISGRHRLDLAKRSGEKTIPAQYHYESEGFGTDQASALDAILNIREGQGKVKDYVEFIKSTKPTKEEADAQGILARQTGKRAYAIATTGSDTLIAAHKNDQITDEGAFRIAAASPKNEKLQAVGIKAIQEGKTIAVAENLVKAVKSMTSETQQDSGDLFGFDDSAMIEAEKLAKAASKKQSEIQRTLSAVQGAAKRPELAAKEGVDVKDPEAVKIRIKELKEEKRQWANWHTNPSLVSELKDEKIPAKIKEKTVKKQAVSEITPKVEKKAKKEVEPKAVKPTKEKAPVDVDKISVEKGYTVKSYNNFRETVAKQTATAKDILDDAENLIANKDKIIAEMSQRKFTKAMLQEIIKSPRNDLSKPQMVKQAYESMLSDHVMADATITIFGGSKSFEEQIIEQVRNQTQADVDKAANNAVQEASMSRDGKITYPKPEEDVNTQQYKKLDNKIVKPPGKGQRIFHAPGHNFIGLFRSTGIPERREFVSIEGRKLKIPKKPQRIEPIISKLIKIMGRRIYSGKVKGKSTQGFYRPDVGEIRTRKKNDVEVLAHEMAHYLDFYSTAQDTDTSGRFLPNFSKLYKQKKYQDEIVGLSYTTADRQIELIEGFAEFVRLWLTNSREALIRAPKFYEAFTNLMARDRKLLNPMRDMQDLMHKFYFQGPDKLGQALIGKDPSFKQRFDEWAYRRDSRIRQQIIDRFHASRKVEQELSRKIGNVQESAWKQFRLANGGSEGISDYIMNYGTVNFDDKGDLQRTGQSLHEVLVPVKSIKLKPDHKGDQKIDVLLRYFAGRRALELHRQGRENLIPKETAKEWARLGKDYPVFESIQKDYQAFNDRMMDFYEEAGMITPEGRKTMSKMNKDYVPFNRIREQLAGGPTGVGGGFQKLKGGTANLNDILVNIQDGIAANVRSALNNRAKQRLYQYISGHKDGAIFATKLAPDSKPVQVYADEMKSKIGKILELNGVVIDGDIDLASKDLLTFWQHGVKPQLNESGNIVDSVIINGKPKYYEVQDPLLQEMLLSMNPESYSSFMNVMFGVKNFFTRMITLGVEFTGANLVRDTIGAAFLSKNNFKPFVDSFKGMYSFITKDEHYQNFIKSGGGYSSRLEAMTKEGTARRRVKLDEFGVMTMPEKLLSTIDNIASAFEYGTRIGEFRLAKKNMKSDMDAGFEAREISTDFSVLGANRFLTGYIRTVPFLNAMIQSQDRVFREAVVRKKYDGNPTALAMKAFLGITVPTLILYLVNKDDEDYKAIPDYEKRTNWHIKVGDGQFVKIPRPYDVGFVYATMPELFAKYVENDKGKEFADGMIWTLTQMYGIDGTPAMMTGWWDLVRNEKWTGAPVVPKSLSDVEAPEQYTSNTAETFVRMGEALGVSPVKAEHIFKSYTGYLGGYLLWGTDHMLWDNEKFGEKPDSKASDNIFLRRFLTPDVRPATAAMEKFFDLKEKSDQIVSTFKQQVDIRRAIKGQLKESQKFKDDRFFGLSGKEKEVLFGLNDSMNQLIKLMYGKEGIKTAELKVKHDKKLTGKQKREKLDQLWNSRNNAFMKYYLQADKALQKAKQESENFKQEK